MGFELTPSGKLIRRSTSFIIESLGTVYVVSKHNASPRTTKETDRSYLTMRNRTCVDLCGQHWLLVHLCSSLHIAQATMISVVVHYSASLPDHHKVPSLLS